MLQSCRENQNKLFVFNYILFENRVVYEVTWKNTVQPDRPQMTIWRKNIACWITNATNTYSEYVIVIFFTATMVARKRLSSLYKLNV